MKAICLLLLLLLVPCLSQDAVEADCLAPNYYVRLERMHGDEAEKEKLFIYKGTYGIKGDLIETIDGNSWNNRNFTYSYCFTPSVYTFTTFQAYEEHWYKSLFVVYVNGVEKLVGYNFDLYTTDWILDLGNLLYDKSWKYSVVPQLTTDWTTTAINDNTWANYKPGNFPNTLAETTRYYITSFDNPHFSDDFFLFESGIYTNEGVIVYINGREIYRFNIKYSENVSPSDGAIADNYEESYRVVKQSIREYLKNTEKLIFAVEIHPIKNGVSHKDTFSGYIVPFYASDNITCTQDGIPTADPEFVDVDINKPEYAFDEDPQTDAQFYPFTGNNSITYTYNNGRAEWINKYSISLNFPSNYGIKNMILSGSNDNISWDILDIEDDIVYGTAYEETLYFDILNNVKSYNQYKLTIKDFIHPDKIGVLLTQLEFYAVSKDMINELKYEKQKYIFLYQKDTVEMVPIITGYTNFICDSTLPTGFSLNNKNGIIKGSNRLTFSPITIIISATRMSTGITESTSITFTVTECYGEDEIYLSIDHYSNTYESESEKWNIKNSNSQLVYSGHGEGYFKSALTKICIPADVYQLTLIANTEYGWDINSKITISYISKHGTLGIYEGVLNHSKTQTIPLSLDFVLPFGSSNSIGRIDGIVPDNWYSIDYIPDYSEWNINLSMSSLPQTTSKLWLFRSTMNINSIDNYNSLEIYLGNYGEFILYWNGDEVYRRCIPYETITSESNITCSTSTYGNKYIEIPIERVKIGTNVLAILVLKKYNTDNNPVYIDMYYYCRLVIESNIVSKKWQITSNHDNADEKHGSSYLIDGKYDTFWSSTHENVTEATNWLTFAYNNYGSSYVNKYCFQNNIQTITTDPIEWIFYGCDFNNENCTILDIESNIHWNFRSEYRCFYTITHQESYPSYKIEFIKSSSIGSTIIYVLYEVDLFAINLSNDIINTLLYSEDILYGYKSAYLTSSKPTNGYRDFSIESSSLLPSGLYIDSSTGIIYGTPTEVTNGTISIIINAYSLQGKPTSVSLNISISECSSPNNIFIIELNHSLDNYGNQIGFKLLGSDGIEILESYNNIPDYSILTFSYCKPQSDYYLQLTDTANDGWDNTYIKVYFEDGTTLLKQSLTKYRSPLIIPFSTHYLTSTSLNTWQYTDGQLGTIYYIQWTKIDYYLGQEWSTGNRQSFGDRKTNTQYYRNIFVINNISKQSAIQYTVYLNSGCVIYLNGKEINRIYMPLGTISFSTLSTYTNENTYVSGGSIPSQFSMGLIEGNNIFAIEVHQKSAFSSENVFSFICSIIPENQKRNVFGSVTSTNLPVNDYNGVNMAFDDSEYTHFVYDKSTTSFTFSYEFMHNRKEYITSYSITNGKYCNNQTPTCWTLVGYINESDSETIHTICNQYFTSYSETKYFEILPKNSYYRIDFTLYDFTNEPIDNSSCTGSKLSSIGLYTKRIEGACDIATDLINPIFNGKEVSRNCPQYYSGTYSSICNNTVYNSDLSTCNLKPVTSISYKNSEYIFEINEDIWIPCFVDSTGLTVSITPALPKDIHLYTNIGAIHVSATYVSGPIEYTVTARNGGVATTKITISIIRVTCPGDENWPEVETNKYSYYNCPNGYGSENRRFCALGGKWEEINYTPECHPVFCEETTYLDIKYDTTQLTFYTISKCDSNTKVGYLKRQCSHNGNYEPFWGPVDYSMCFNKETQIDGSANIEMSINLVNTTSIEDPFYLCYQSARSIILSLPYMISNLIVTTNASQIFTGDKMNKLDIIIGTSKDNYISNIQNSINNSKNKILNTINHYSHEIVSNITSDHISINSKQYGNTICTADDNVSSNLKLYEYSFYSCDNENTKSYPLYQCRQINFDVKNVLINYMKCPSHDNSYISYNLKLEGISTLKLSFSNYISIYRAILKSTNVIIKTIYITRYEDINDNNDTLIKLYIRTISSDINNDAYLLKNLDNNQMRKFIRNLSISIKSATIDTSVENVTNNYERRLRGI
ncbi:hypothetical protein WA158_000220 [Blastocystis sp. Blastoise]